MTLRRMFYGLAVLGAVVCGLAQATEVRPDPTFPAVGEAASDAGSCEPAGASVCAPDRASVQTCVGFFTPPGHRPPPPQWGDRVACPAAGTCISHEENGVEQDYCGECVPGTSFCDGATHLTHSCTSAGHWAIGGSCTPSCPCGGLYPSHCMICR